MPVRYQAALRPEEGELYQEGSALSARNRHERRIERWRELLYDLCHVVPVDDERRGEHHVIAEAPVDGAAHRIADEATFHRFSLHRKMQPELRIEWRLGSTVSDQFDPQ